MCRGAWVLTQVATFAERKRMLESRILHIPRACEFAQFATFF